MRLSRSRVLLRVALLATGGVYMLFRAVEAWRAAHELDAGDAALQARVALIALLIGVLAILTAASAALSLRPRKRGGSLHLGVSRQTPRDPPAPGGPLQ